MQPYRPLRVWRKSFAHALNVRRATQRFPNGYAELKGQIIRSAESIVHNIVEGCGTDSQKDFARFLQFSIKSATELEGQLDLAHGYKILSESPWRSLGTETVDIRRMLCGLRNTVLGRDPSESISHAKRTTQNCKRVPRRSADIRATEESATHPVEKERTGDQKGRPP